MLKNWGQTHFFGICFEEENIQGWGSKFAYHQRVCGCSSKTVCWHSIKLLVLFCAWK